MTPNQRPPTAVFLQGLRPALILLVVAWLAGCASPTPPVGSPTPPGGPSVAASSEGIAPDLPWTATESTEAKMTGAGQQAVVTVKVPEDLDRCPFPGYSFGVPKGSSSLRAWLNVSASHGWLSMELYGPTTSHYPNGTVMVQTIPVHADMEAQTAMAVAGPESGQWMAGLKPQGAFDGSFTLTVAVSGTGKAPSGLGLKMTC